jgi:hypothetical protein
MRNLTPLSITQAFADYCANAPSARTRELMVSLAGGVERRHRRPDACDAVHRRQAERIHPVF